MFGRKLLLTMARFILPAMFYVSTMEELFRQKQMEEIRPSTIEVQSLARVMVDGRLKSMEAGKPAGDDLLGQTNAKV